MTTNSNGNIDFSITCADAGLHLACGAHRIIDRWKRCHHLVTDRLDDGAIELVRGVLHDVETTRHGLTGFGIAEFVVKLGAANYISKQNRDFQVFGHPVVIQLHPNIEARHTGRAGTYALTLCSDTGYVRYTLVRRIMH
jgi:hypothetical protein